MSAIAGIYHLNNEPINLEHGNRIMKALEKFPADDVQVWNNDKVFLGCHAQWITPESLGEKLPYYDHERRLAITADAIIDNRDELFERLQIDRDRRKKITDSELILLAYHKWGEDSPKYLVGDFAFMIWDDRKNQLFGARDFSGARTLYYFKDHRRISFCTTIEPLLELPFIEKNLNEIWLAEFLAISGMIDAVDTSITPYKTINQVPPSHCILVTKDKTVITQYCTLEQGSRLKLKSDGEYIEAFQDIFQKAVNSRLRTYKNVGAQLSGGLDSGSVVAFASKSLQACDKKLHTFSYIPPKGFKDFTAKQLLADERPFIKKTVDYVGGITEHYSDFEGKNSLFEIDDFLNILEMPYKFFENSFWLKGMFEEAQKEGVGVLLNGDRGNFTISWGFALEYYAILLKRLKWVRLFNELNQYSRIMGGARLRNLPDIARIGFPLIDKMFPEGTPYSLPKLINPTFARNTDVFNRFEKHGINETGWYANLDIFDERRRNFKDVFQWNAGNTLAAKLSLRYSLWKRDPSNDLRVVRFCLSVPEDQCVQNGLDRALIRRATKEYLPDEVRLNQRIRGVQGVDWVYRMVPCWGQFIEELKEMLCDKKIMGILDRQVIGSALAKVESVPRIEGATDPQYKILMRSLIVYRFIKGIL
jgi:asparagine synthase (glutamine-hydrolysing)